MLLCCERDETTTESQLGSPILRLRVARASPVVARKTYRRIEVNDELSWLLVRVAEPFLGQLVRLKVDGNLAASIVLQSTSR
jgi:hypothetical protein